jgi:hypothetical protein
MSVRRPKKGPLLHGIETPDRCFTNGLAFLFPHYSHPVVHQLFELRRLPATALVSLGTPWGILKFGKNDSVQWSKVFLRLARVRSDSAFSA